MAVKTGPAEVMAAEVMAGVHAAMLAGLSYPMLADAAGR
jgi:hypothetical protein